MTQSRITSYLPLQLAVGTSFEDAKNVNNLDTAIAHASDEDHIIYVMDRHNETIFTLNAYGQPNSTLTDVEKELLQYIKDGEGDDVKK